MLLVNQNSEHLMSCVLLSLLLVHTHATFFAASVALQLLDKLTLDASWVKAIAERVKSEAGRVQERLIAKGQACSLSTAKSSECAQVRSCLLS